MAAGLTNGFLLVSGCLSSSVKICWWHTLPLLWAGPLQQSILFYPITLEEYFHIQNRSRLNKPEIPKRNHFGLLVRFASCSVAYHPSPALQRIQE